MSRLVLLRRYIEEHFEEASRPQPATFIDWCLKGEYPPNTLKKLGRRYYVDVDLANNPDRALVEAATQ